MSGEQISCAGAGAGDGATGVTVPGGVPILGRPPVSLRPTSGMAPAGSPPGLPSGMRRCCCSSSRLVITSSIGPGASVWEGKYCRQGPYWVCSLAAQDWGGVGYGRKDVLQSLCLLNCIGTVMSQRITCTDSDLCYQCALSPRHGSEQYRGGVLPSCHDYTDDGASPTWCCGGCAVCHH